MAKRSRTMAMEDDQWGRFSALASINRRSVTQQLIFLVEREINALPEDQAAQFQDELAKQDA